LAQKSRLAALVVGLTLASLGVAPLARATVGMQKEARKLGFPVKNCLYCHATPHAVEVMKTKARSMGMNEGNCLLCHGAKIPATLNDRGEWLVAEKDRRKAARPEMSWLADYVEPKKDETDGDGPSPPRP